jgi:hypothetical protein
VDVSFVFTDLAIRKYKKKKKREKERKNIYKKMKDDIKHKNALKMSFITFQHWLQIK